VLELKLKILNCHNCGAEAVDECEGYTKPMHIPAYPKVLPCKICIRNPEAAGWWDMYSENWTFMISHGKVEPMMDDATEHDQKLLDIVQALLFKRECCKDV
jgi:hypothetical protein